MYNTNPDSYKSRSTPRKRKQSVFSTKDCAFAFKVVYGPSGSVSSLKIMEDR